MTRYPRRNRAKPRRFPGKGPGGFTLIEALIAAGAFVIVLLAIYSGFESSRATYEAGQQKAGIQQSARIAVELMEGDLMLAGYGFPKSGADCDGDLNPDNAIMVASPTLVTFCADPFNASTIIVNADVSPGDTILSVQKASAIQAGNTIFLINGGRWEPLTVQALNTGSTPHVITTTPGVTDSYPWGSQVGRPLRVSYCWYDAPDVDGIPAPAPCAGLPPNTLYRDRGAGAGYQPLANNIQSLRFQYFDANDVATANPVDIRRISITVTAQAPPGWWRPQTFSIVSDVRPRNLH